MLTIMHTAEWIKQKNFSFGEAARVLGLPNAMSVRRYALNLELPRPERMREMFSRSNGKIDRWGRGETIVTLADLDGDGVADQVNGVSTS